MGDAHRIPDWTADRGLTAVEAQNRQARDGPNELSPPIRRSLWRQMLEASRDPMFRLLVAAGVVYLLLGEVSDALVLLGFVLFSASITLVQEQRTEKVLNALRELSSPRAWVVREGQRQRIAGNEVVCGDLLVVSEGDRIAADAILREASALCVDESVLTGESFPVDKTACTQDTVEPSARIFGGTLVVRGQGLAQVVATGARSEMGRIGHSLADIARPASPLVAQTRQLVRLFSIAGLALSMAMAVLYGLLRGDWLAAILAGITLAMSLLPEEFALILAVFMAMGAWRLSRERVLTRRSNALEALGSTTVLCTDKTGTLTYNRMQVVALARWTGTGFEPLQPLSSTPQLPADFRPLVLHSRLASEQAPQDPMDKALVALWTTTAKTDHLNGWTPVHTYGLTPQCLAVTRLWRTRPDPSVTTLTPGTEATAPLVVAAKGAPEAIATLCGLDTSTHQALQAQTLSLAQQGWRVLAVARATVPDEDWPETPQGLGLSLLGVVALADPLREGVRASVQECHGAGIRVVMITGDHPVTAHAIAQQAGINTLAPAITGAAVARMDDAALQRVAATTTVYARVMPQQKLRIVQALREQGQVVAMTGDGVNDAPSLQAAHIGIAMGQRGTDVAREAASLVLLDDDFVAIVKATRLGRRVHDNLRKALAFVLAVHVPIAGLALLPLLMGWPLIFYPVHIACLELLIDPVCSIAFEAEPAESDLMRRPPRDPAAPLFPWPLALWSLVQGSVVLAGVASLAAWTWHQGLDANAARATLFIALVGANGALILANRAYSQSLWRSLVRPNATMWRLLIITGASLVLIVGWPPLRQLFQFTLPPLDALIGAAGVVVGVLGLLGLLRHWRPQA